jgi:hypothetical protein
VERAIAVCRLPARSASFQEWPQSSLTLEGRWDAARKFLFFRRWVSRNAVGNPERLRPGETRIGISLAGC